MATQVRQLADSLSTCQEDLQIDIVEIKSIFDKLLVALDDIRGEVAGIGERLQRNHVRTQLNIVAVRRRLRNLQTTVATAAAVESAGKITQETVERVGALTQETIKRIGISTQRTTQESIERLGVAVQQGFTVIEARFASGGRPHYDQDQLAAQLIANSFIMAFARLLYS